MKVLITGICGRIGGEVASQLLAQKHEVIGFDVVKPKSPIEGVSYFQGNLHNPEELAPATKEADAVAHLGAHMSWNPDEDTYSFRSNVDGTFELLNLTSKKEISRFVFASSGEVYPEVLPEYQPVDEKHPQNPTSLYGETKKLGEEMVRFFHQRKGVPTTVLRFPHTQRATELLDPDSFFSGPRFFLQPKIKQMISFRKPEAVEALKKHDPGKLCHLIQCDEKGESHAMHISDVRDTANAVVLALTHPAAAGESFNVTTDESLAFSDVVPQMAKITGLDVIRVNLPGPAVRYHTSNAKIKKILGYSPKFTFDKMLEEAAVAWREKRG